MVVRNLPPPRCLKCNRPMRWALRKAGGRRFRCLDCDGEYPLKSPERSKDAESKATDQASVALQSTVNARVDVVGELQCQANICSSA
jgi:hypothetical protein